MAKQPESPGSRLEAAVLEEFDLDPPERALLSQAAVIVDILERVNAAVREGALTTEGSRGQPVASPLLREQREYVARLEKLLRAMKLPVGGEEHGRSSRSRSAAHAARVRWGVH